LAEGRTEFVRDLLTEILHKQPNTKSKCGYKIGECRLDGKLGYSWYVGEKYMPTPNGPKKMEIWQCVRYQSKDD